MATEATGERILIIDDNSAFSVDLSNGLKREGYATTLVKTGPDAVRAIYDTLPHLVILDTAVTSGDSYGILAEKQADPMLAKIPVFMISAKTEPINMGRVPQGSVLEFFMSLSIQPSTIIEKVNAHFGHQSHVDEAATPAPGSKKKILWVEDDKLIGTILAKKLVNSNFDLFHAKNGEEALEMIKSFVPDLIVLDLILPGMSGFDILAAIRKDQHVLNVPVMILSNLSKQSDIERTQAMGAKKFVVKASASLDQIVEEVRALAK